MSKLIKRRSFLKGAAVAGASVTAVAAANLAAPAIAQGKRENGHDLAQELSRPRDNC